MTPTEPMPEQVLETLDAMEAQAQATLEEITEALHQDEQARLSTDTTGTGVNLSDPNYPPPWDRAILQVALVQEETKLATVAEIRSTIVPEA